MSSLYCTCVQCAGRFIVQVHVQCTYSPSFGHGRFCHHMFSTHTLTPSPHPTHPTHPSHPSHPPPSQQLNELELLRRQMPDVPMLFVIITQDYMSTRRPSMEQASHNQGVLTHIYGQLCKIRYPAPFPLSLRLYPSPSLSLSLSLILVRSFMDGCTSVYYVLQLSLIESMDCSLWFFARKWSQL